MECRSLEKFTCSGSLVLGFLAGCQVLVVPEVLLVFQAILVTDRLCCQDACTALRVSLGLVVLMVALVFVFLVVF